MDVSNEIYLNKNHITKEEWNKFIKVVSNFNGFFKTWKLIVMLNKSQIRYYVLTRCSLPATINNIDAFMLKGSNYPILEKYHKKRWFLSKFENNLIDIINICEIKNKGVFQYLEISFKKLSDSKIITKVSFNVSKNNQIIKYKIKFYDIANLLSLDFKGNKRYLYKSTPKYLDINKILHLLNTDKNSSILEIDTFPYIQGKFFLSQNEIDFFKHSVVIGSSGSGKSKFISNFLHNLYKKDLFNTEYKVVLIDPHASLINDIGGFSKVIDFSTINNSINLFANNKEDIISSTEILVSLFKDLIGSVYNSKLERVLRHSIHILLEDNNFNFTNLRKLLLDIEYRNNLVNNLKIKLPMSVVDFFLADFNDLKTKSYGEAIAPIISFIDELQMIPVFNNKGDLSSLNEVINDNFLTLFSLDRTKIGDKVTKTISGLIMQQLLNLIQVKKRSEHIIFVIDEVAIIENPILTKFLAEARKYNLSLILISQYFNQISENLKDAIFANTINYYIFRVSKLDANLLVDNFNMKVPLDDTKEQKVKILSELNNRECIVRIASKDIILPAFKAKTLDFQGIPYININEEKVSNEEKNQKFQKTFIVGKNISLKDVLLSNSTSREDDEE